MPWSFPPDPLWQGEYFIQFMTFNNFRDNIEASCGGRWGNKNSAGLRLIFYLFYPLLIPVKFLSLSHGPCLWGNNHNKKIKISTNGLELADFPSRELLFGLTSIESYLDLSAQDLEFGFNETRRDRILRTYVRNIYHYHLNEIYSALKVNGTDTQDIPFWETDTDIVFFGG